MIKWFQLKVFFTLLASACQVRQQRPFLSSEWSFKCSPYLKNRMVVRKMASRGNLWILVTFKWYKTSDLEYSMLSYISNGQVLWYNRSIYSLKEKLPQMIFNLIRNFTLHKNYRTHHSFFVVNIVLLWIQEAHFTHLFQLKNCGAS
jgi:hypothetical protein